MSLPTLAVRSHVPSRRAGARVWNGHCGEPEGQDGCGLNQRSAASGRRDAMRRAAGANLGAVVLGDGLAEVVKHNKDDVRRCGLCGRPQRALEACCRSDRSGRPRTMRWLMRRQRPWRVCRASARGRTRARVCDSARRRQEGHAQRRGAPAVSRCRCANAFCNSVVLCAFAPKLVLCARGVARSADLTTDAAKAKSHLSFLQVCARMRRPGFPPPAPVRHPFGRSVREYRRGSWSLCTGRRASRYAWWLWWCMRVCGWVLWVWLGGGGGGGGAGGGGAHCGRPR